MAQFGIQIEPQFGFDYSTLKDLALECESVGFNSMWLSDHLFLDARSQERNCLDCWTTLAALAAETTSLRLGSLVTCVSYHYPPILAKMAATVDVISKGRLEFGIGAGWNEPECTAMGGDFAHRWTQTKDSIHAMKALWTEDDAEYHGKYYDFDPMACFPKPSRKPHPPILLGSIGSPRVYKRVAEWGDGWLPFCTDPQELADGKAEIAKYSAQFGRDPASLEIALFAPDGMFRTAAELGEMARAGADTAVLWLRGQDEKELLAELDELAAAVF